MKIGFVQNDPEFGNKEKNLKEIIALLKGTIADLVVLPELCITGYTFRSKEELKQLAEPVEGPTFHQMSELSESTGAVIVAGFAEVDDGKLYNSCMMVYKNKLIGLYRKLHLFNKENLWFNSGNLPLKAYDINGYKIGMMICFDWIFPEAFRTLSIDQAQVVAHPANLVMPYCQESMKTRCLENGVFAVTANRIGREQRGTDDFTFTGASQITSNKGKVLSSAPINETHVNFIDIDPSLSDNKMINEHNNLIKDRRTEFYK